MCGEYTDNLVHGKHCVRCYRKKYSIGETTRQWRAHKRQESNAILNDWLGKIKLLPSSYPTLTQDQWLATCGHFNGCAYCSAESIDSRVYFIPFKLGGRYCDWNIIPACEKCAMRVKLIDNPFVYAERPNERQALQRIINYLEERLNAAVEKTSKINKCADPAANSCK